MTRTPPAPRPEPGNQPTRIRVVTAASLFDGHDAAINIMRRVLLAKGAEVIHIGHDRSVDDIVTVAIQEDAHAIAVSCYQGGHNEFFRYMIDELRQRGAPHVRVFGGGGGTILSEEISALHAYGVTRIFSPEDGRRMGLEGMIDFLLSECRDQNRFDPNREIDALYVDNSRAIARLITWLENHKNADSSKRNKILGRLSDKIGEPAKVVGFTGTGGAGKSSIIDEVVRRIHDGAQEASIGILLIDPSRRRTGGALLGDRIRMNAIYKPGIYVRSIATRASHVALSASVKNAIAVLQAARFDLIIIETAGIGQSSSEVVDVADLSVYVMTPDYGAQSQLEKIDMLDLADLVVINKFDRKGGKDALRDVRKQWRNNRKQFNLPDRKLPIFTSIANRWDDPGVDQITQAIRHLLTADPQQQTRDSLRPSVRPMEAKAQIPPSRMRYLAEIADAVRSYRKDTELCIASAQTACALYRTLRGLEQEVPRETDFFDDEALADASADPVIGELRERYNQSLAELEPELRRALCRWADTRADYDRGEQQYRVRDATVRVETSHRSLSQIEYPKVALPRFDEWGELVRFLRQENLPGCFPFTAGVFPFRRQGEEPGRMFAGEGGPERTNRRFHLLAEGQKSSRLSTAFDSVTLYGRDPDQRPDVYGKIGNSGVSVCTVDDAKKLYSGFDLCDPLTSVSMTINGPAPILLAFFVNAAIDQQIEKHLVATGGLEDVRRRFEPSGLPVYREQLPEGHSGLGLGLLGIPGELAVDAETYGRIKNEVLSKVRGTVQADILKEQQAQNTCIFSIGFALKMMGDVQQYFIENEMRNFYSVSVSGYHIAEAGANPVTQLALTLANGFTYVEYYLSRGMEIDAFAPNFSFFFSNGLDIEYSVIGRVARRIWAIAMRDRYGANERSQKLKYHIQTSGRSLHAQEMNFNDIRTTLQALTAIVDNCNSLHTNAFDEAVTTPTEASVRRAVAIQLIINRELGLSACENLLQGSYSIEAISERVEEAVLQEFERLSERGGVLGAMETLYQRHKIQDESMLYESLKHTGELPIIGVNTFENPAAAETSPRADRVIRSSDEEKRAQIENLRAFQDRWADRSQKALIDLKIAASRGENVFRALMEAAKYLSLGQITDALFEVGGEYRRTM